MQWTNKTFPSEQEHIQSQKATSMSHWMDIHPPHPGLKLLNFIVFFLDLKPALSGLETQQLWMESQIKCKFIDGTVR